MAFGHCAGISERFGQAVLDRDRAAKAANHPRGSGSGPLLARDGTAHRRLNESDELGVLGHLDGYERDGHDRCPGHEHASIFTSILPSRFAVSPERQFPGASGELTDGSHPFQIGHGFLRLHRILEQ